MCMHDENWRTPELDKELKCYFLHHRDPFARLGPFKVEEKSKNPFILMFREFLLSSEIHHLKNVAINNLQRSTYAGESHNEDQVYRTSKQTWLHDKIFEFHSQNKSLFGKKHIF